MFKNAKSVFIRNQSLTLNYFAGFECEFNADKSKDYKLDVAGSTYLRIFLNGEFIYFGPARAPHGYLKYDTINLNAKQGKNTLYIEVAGYNCASFYTMEVRSFLRAEIFENGESLKYTGRDFKGYDLNHIKERLAMRYSFQRSFCEVWTLGYEELKKDEQPLDEVMLTQEYIKREVLVPEFNSYTDVEPYETGKVKELGKFENYDKRFVQNISWEVTGYRFPRIKDDLMQEMNIDFIPCEISALTDNTYKIFKFANNNTGFIDAEILAEKDSVIYFFFSECLTDGKIYFGLDDDNMINVVKYNLKKSDKPYKLKSFECYGFKYLGVRVKSGEIKINSVGITEYSYPLYKNTTVKCENNVFDGIFLSSTQTYRQNSVDTYMDCPTRERAGWLCDSYFTSQCDPYFTGNNTFETMFLNNFAMAKEFPTLPDGMLPMVYPGEERTGGYIPQWAMWYVVELGMYIDKTGNNPEKYKKLVYGLLNFFEKYENKDGLLEKLPAWNFVEWSDANKWVQDINYPTNMLYSKILTVAGTIFNDKSKIEKSEHIKEEIIKESFDGHFFIDNAIIKDGKACLTENRSEICQHEAILFDIAKQGDNRFEKLYDTVLNDFGPDRKAKKLMPEIAYADAFIGYSVRVEVLLKLKEYAKALSQIEKYYGHMSEITGTMWEHDYPGSSQNHGFQSFIGVAVLRSLTGVQKININEKKLFVDKEFTPIYDCEINIGDIKITCKNKKREIAGNSFEIVLN